VDDHPARVAEVVVQPALHVGDQPVLKRLPGSGRPWQLAVAELMTDAERIMADHWARVERAAEDAAEQATA
jgi:hypothetical protein